jgi:tRNA pseudouridine38-40 synthase
MLPADIVRVLNGFNSKNFCDGRIYEYLLPTYILEPLSNWQDRLDSVTEEMELEADMFQIDATTLKVNRHYRISSTELDTLRIILKGFEGTHNHHNFTIGKNASDPSCKRYITSFIAHDPQIYYFKNSTGENVSCGEWVSIKVRGQSFMLHQIRKMVGLAILMMKTQTPYHLRDELLQKTVKVNVPKAPGLGLLLEQCLFDVYNQKAEIQRRSQIHFSHHEDNINEFKRQFIYDNIVREEFQTKWYVTLLVGKFY